MYDWERYFLVREAKSLKKTLMTVFCRVAIDQASRF